MFRAWGGITEGVMWGDWVGGDWQSCAASVTAGGSHPGAFWEDGLESALGGLLWERFGDQVDSHTRFTRLTL